MNPLVLATLIVALVALAGLITAMVRNARKLRGYAEFAADARAITKKLNGELFRDGEDLVISGNYHQLPTIARLSRSEDTPGLSIEVKVPANFTFSLTPRLASVIPQGANIDVPNLYANFLGRTNSVLEAKELVGTSSVRKAISAICISQKTFLGITPGQLLINELLIPPNLADRVMVELQAVSVIAAQLEKFPGADALKIKQVKYDRTSWAFRGVLAAGIIVTVAGLAQSAVTGSKKPSPVAPAEVTNSISKNDAVLIPKMQDWHPADESSFDPAFVSWLRSYGVDPSGVFEFSSDNSGLRNGKAYFLINDKGQKRVVAIVDHRVLFDGIFDNAAGIAIVPSDSAKNVQWPLSRAPFKEVPGDGLLVVRDFSAKDGATLFFFGANGYVSGMPENYQQLDIQ